LTQVRPSTDHFRSLALHSTIISLTVSLFDETVAVLARPSPEALCQPGNIMLLIGVATAFLFVISLFLAFMGSRVTNKSANYISSMIITYALLLAALRRPWEFNSPETLASLALCMLVAISVIVVLKYSQDFLLLAPILFAQIFLLAWVNTCRIGKIASKQSLIVNLLMIVFGGGLSYCFWKLKQKSKIKIISALFLIILISPLFRLSGSLRQHESFAENKFGRNQTVRHVILISIDTLRQDALSCYNKGTLLTPNIDALSRDGLIFKNAFSTSSWTWPSFVSIMTGHSTFTHMAEWENVQIPKELPTLAERMATAGYITAAIGSNPYLATQNISRGFERYDFFPKPSFGTSIGSFLLIHLVPNEFMNQATTSDLETRSLTWLTSHSNDNFFLWIHFFDPHFPYDPPEDLIHRLPEDAHLKRHQLFSEIRSGKIIPMKQKERLKRLYRGEVQHVDRSIGRIIQTLKLRKIYNDSLILLLSDHGEELWDHNGFGHGHTLYNELVVVPLIIKLPGSVKKGTIHKRISTDTVSSIILEIAGLDPSHTNSLNGFIADGTGSSSPILSTSYTSYDQKISLIFEDYKYIKSQFSQQEELYNLISDPQEKTSLSLLKPEKIQEARGLVQKIRSMSIQMREKHHIKNENRKRSPEIEDELNALGYFH
jgi:arylsulfatase A-like enzyme